MGRYCSDQSGTKKTEIITLYLGRAELQKCIVGHSNLLTMNEETNTYDFAYLKQWSTDQLKNRLGAIMPTIDFLLAMHNAQDKIARIDMSCIDAKSKILKEHSIHLGTFSTFQNGFPATFEQFIHNFCTFLCAEKHHIELYLTKE